MKKRVNVATAATVSTMLFVLGGMACAGTAGVRKSANTTKAFRSLSQLSIAQQNYATGQNQKGQAERFVTGVEGFCQPESKPLPQGDRLSDGSRAFVYLTKKNFIDTFAMLASPGDPFVAPLDLPGTALRDLEERDFPTEGVPPAGSFAAAPAPKPIGNGHTFYSFSMQAGSMEKRIHPSTYMAGELPLFTDRNPWSEPLVKLAGKDPDAGSETGNTWNNNREFQLASYRDGNSNAIPDARKALTPELPDPARVDPAKRGRPVGETKKDDFIDRDFKKAYDFKDRPAEKDFPVEKDRPADKDFPRDFKREDFKKEDSKFDDVKKEALLRPEARFVFAAAAVEPPVPQPRPYLDGNDYLYGDDAMITTGLSKPVGMKYFGVGGTPKVREHQKGSWMTD